jgi:hypothetical protein
MNIKIQTSACLLALLLNTAAFSSTSAVLQDKNAAMSSGTVNVINENFKDLVVVIAAQGSMPAGKTLVTYDQKIGAGEETKFNIRYLDGAQFYSITGFLVKGTPVPFTTSTCTNLSVDRHYKVTFTQIGEFSDVAAHCKAQLLDEAGQIVQ